MKQNESLAHLDHCLYEILRSPLGVIFGSYLFMSKHVNYSLTANCKDIMEKLKATTDPNKVVLSSQANYILKVLNG